MRITLGRPVLQSTGSADDGDAATAPCSYGPAPGRGRCTDAQSLSTANPAAVTRLSATAQAINGPNSTTAITANAKAESQASLQITYTFWERILAFFGRKQRLAASVNLSCFADVNDGPNQATFAVFITGGGGAGPLPLYQHAYGFKRDPADPAVLIVEKDGAAVDTTTNPGPYSDSDPGRTVPIDPGNYNLKFEINSVARADGRVTVSAIAVLKLAQA